ncbi:hypothetical protein [Levilactobacillus tongjiangensis]|uniref:Cell surface protein n=1 Tax=Levilactobacillus tongjiangensis TaxID=2486023 RepID=A0ABW1SR74_9LACO|nr:hypothetical protein [Levilactobacillus tongjiangensis]
MRGKQDRFIGIGLMVMMLLLGMIFLGNTVTAKAAVIQPEQESVDFVVQKGSTSVRTTPIDEDFEQPQELHHSADESRHTNKSGIQPILKLSCFGVLLALFTVSGWQISRERRQQKARLAEQTTQLQSRT